jgi:hypothetical protein
VRVLFADGTLRLWVFARLEAVPLQNAHCETIDVKDGTPPPAPPLSKTAIHNLARDSNT